MCGHAFDLPAHAPTRSEYRCLPCALLPEAPKRTAAEKRAHKASMIAPDAWPVLVALARGQWPWVPGGAGLQVTSAIIRLQRAGYVAHDPEQAERHQAATQYVATPLGHAAAVHADAEEWNASPALWAAVAARP